MNLDDHSTCSYAVSGEEAVIRCTHGHVPAYDSEQVFYLGSYVEELTSIVREVVRVSDDIVGMVRPYFKEPT